MKQFILIAGLPILLLACNNKNTPTKEQANEFAIAIHTNTCCDIKADQQNFVNEFVAALNQFHDDKNANIDISKLRNSLVKAQRANKMSLDALSKLNEVDNDINLKNKALAQVNADKSIFEIASKIIDAMEKKDYYKVTETIGSFSEMEKQIKKVRSEVREADSKFTEKYKILPFVDNSPVSK